nr:unnamed protein product [Digitaria exilis]
MRRRRWISGSRCWIPLLDPRLPPLDPTALATWTPDQAEEARSGGAERSCEQGVREAVKMLCCSWSGRRHCISSEKASKELGVGKMSSGGTSSANAAASSASASTGRGRPKRKNAPGNRSDPGWEHGTEIDSKLKTVKLKVHMQLDRFKSAKGLFGDAIAVLTRSKKTPADWWDSYGDECPELKRFAIRVLSLTCSSSGCERNWSTFEMVHSKRRNRLHQEKMNDLVFVMYNLKLKERQLRRDSKISYDPDDVPSDDEWITKKENPALPQDKHWLRNLDRIAQRTANLTLEDDDAEAEVETMVRDIDESFGGGEDDNEHDDHEDNEDNHDDDYQPFDEDAPSRHEDSTRNPNASCVGSSSGPSDDIIPDAAVNVDHFW